MTRNRFGDGGFQHVAMMLGVLCALVHAAAAQTPVALTKGTRVRVVIPATEGQPERYVEGSLVRLERDTVVLASGGIALGGVQTVVLEAGRHIDVFANGRGHGGRGALIGAAVGALTGGLVGAATWQPCAGEGIACIFYPTRGQLVLEVGLVGAAAGGLVGLAIGASIRDKIWLPVATAGVRVAVGARAVRIGLAF